MKSILKNIVAGILGWQVRRLRRKNNFKIVGVVGSIGKTSTKLAIAKILSVEKRVRYQEGNYNDIVSVPLIFFGHDMPSLWNIFSWLKIIFQNEIQIFSKFPYDVVVTELGTDKPGDIAAFRKYLHLDVAVVTAITSEHMEFFKTIENVAEEEWSVSHFSDLILANRDLCQIVPDIVDHKKIIFYGKDFGAIYKIANIKKTVNGFDFEITYKGGKMVNLSYPAVSEIQLYSLCAAAAIARMFSVSPSGIEKLVKSFKGFAGRMQKLKGIKGSTIIDDTYNASPEAMKIALDTLYSYEAPQRIAILGMMNELGEISETEHKKVGAYCDPQKLDLVVTVGEHANRWLSPAAREKSCQVYEAKNSKEAGEYLKDKIKEDAVILAKGSQNGVFTEEALKPLLANSSDISRLVRQDREWLRKKKLQG